MTDFYNTLGVDRSADQETIKRAYRKLAAQHHPDRGGDTNKFQEIQAAYDTLSDPDKKSQYDNPQPQGFHFQFNSGGFPPGFENIFTHHFSNSPFGDMFGRQSPKNRNLNLQTEITLEEAFTGKDLMMTIRLPSGREQVVDFKIPSGIHENTTVRLQGMGDDSIPNAPRGDLHINIFVRPHHEYSRQNDDLVKVLDLNCLEAIVGKTIQITTIDNKTLDIHVKPGTQNGQVLSIQGYGMPNMNSKIRGKLLLHVNIIVPQNLTEHQKKLIRQAMTA